MADVEASCAKRAGEAFDAGARRQRAFARQEEGRRAPFCCRASSGSGAELKEKKTWRDIWGAGQSAGQVHDAPPVAEVVAPLRAEYAAARARLAADAAPYGSSEAAAAE